MYLTPFNSEDLRLEVKKDLFTKVNHFGHWDGFQLSELIVYFMHLIEVVEYKILENP